MNQRKKISPMQALKLRHTEVVEPKHVTDHSSHEKLIIAWEKWRCPLGTNFREEEWPGAFSPPREDEDDEIDFGESTMIDEEVEYPPLGKGIPLINTPFGIIPVVEHTNPAKIFNFWSGHTNFKINRAIQKLIEDVSGVETLDIWTPLRFRLGVGKLFNDMQVRHAIDVKLAKYFHNRESVTWPPLKLSGEIYRKKAN